MKQEKRNKQLTVSMVILTIAIAAFWFFAFRDDHIEVDETLFHIENLEAADKIEFESKDGKVVLQFNGSRWKVNETYDADRRGIKVLFGTLTSIRPKRPVSENRKQEVEQTIRLSGTTVRVFVKDQLMKSFLVGGNQQKTEAWVQLPDGDLYVAGIPGYRVYAAGVFEQSLNDWRDKRVFNLTPINFKSLTTTFTRDQKEMFTIVGNGSFFSIEGMNVADTAKVNTYLDDASLLLGDRFYTQGQNARVDSLVAGPTSFEVVFTDRGDQLHRLEVFPPLRNESSVFGRVKGEIMVFPRAEIVRLAKKRAWFAASDKVE